MKTAEILTLMDYDHWAIGRVLESAAKVSPEQFVATPDPHTASLQATLLHVLHAERLWRTRLEMGPSWTPPRAEDSPDVETLRQRWDEAERAMRAYLSTLDDDALDRTVRYRRSSGELSDPFTRWHTLMGVVLHSAQHRSEAAALLTVYGHSPGDLDFGYFLSGRR